jgi:ABC-type sugar transport system ATPase subunit
MPEPLLEMKGISKSFGGNTVLYAVDLELRPHEVHALVGENGAGKSTLMKILNGVYRRDSGTIRLEGREIDISNPHDARRAGLSMIFQEHMLAPHLSVAANVFLGIEPARLPGILDDREMEARTQRILQSHNFPIDASAPVNRLSPAETQMVEIARALNGATRVVVMDEPTAVLSQRECEELFRIIRELRERGLAIVYITHRMEELARIADQITILRDGRRVYAGPAASIDSAGIIRHMVDREIRELYPPRNRPSGQVVLEVRRLDKRGSYRNVSFVLHRGEVLGLAGLVGAGRTALARAVFGLEPPDSGSILLEGRTVRLGSPRAAISSGLGFLAEDRKATCLFPHLSLIHNISIAALDRIAAGPVLRLSEEARQCGELSRDLQIRAAWDGDPVYRLSGGNQQKSVVARWLFARSNVLLLDEPTQGVDVGARAEIYRLIRRIADHGGAVLMISSDLPELIGMSHRIAVMRRGELVAALDAEHATQEEIMRHAALV